MTAEGPGGTPAPTFFKLLQDVQGSAGSGYGFAFFGGEACELESVAVASAVAYNAIDFDRFGGDRNGELQGDGRADVPAIDKDPGHSALVDVQRAPTHFAVFDSENSYLQFGFEFVSLITATVQHGLARIIHRGKTYFHTSKGSSAGFVELFGNWNSTRGRRL